jgi:hypothetical protein
MINFTIEARYDVKIFTPLNPWAEENALATIKYAFSRYHTRHFGMASAELQLTYLRAKYCYG